MKIKLKIQNKKKKTSTLSIIEINNIEKLFAKKNLNECNGKTKYSRLLKEIRYSLNLLESYRNEYNDEDVKIYISKKSNVRKNAVLKANYFSKKSIYLCLKTIIEDGKKNNLSSNETFENVNQYIDLLDKEHLIDEDYYRWIKAAENVCLQMYDIFLCLIFESEDTIIKEQEYKKEQENKVKIFYI